MSRYALTKTQVGTKAWDCCLLPAYTVVNMRIIGAAVGNIIAIIITAQMAMKSTALIPMVRPIPMA